MLYQYKRYATILCLIVLLTRCGLAFSAESKMKSSPAAQSAGAEVAKKDTEVCGISGTGIDPNDSDAVDEYLHRITSQGRRRWRASLENSSSLEVRILGLYLHYEDVFSYKIPGSAEAAIAPLVEVAKKTRNPAIFAFVYNACQRNYLPDYATSHCDELTEKH